MWKLLAGLLFLGVASFGMETNQFRTIGKGAFSAIQEPLQVIVTNQTQWAELWQKHSAQKLPPPPLPEIDFSKETVIFVGLGRKNTGGYAIQVTAIKCGEGKTEVVVATREPKPGGLNLQSLTAPFHIVAAPRIEGAVAFKAAENKKGT